MREIKFRAWDKEVECMHYPTYSSIEGYRYRWLNARLSLISGKIYTVDEGQDMLPSHVNQDIVNIRDFPFMQYTVLKDKDGVEIYEGDIVGIIPEKGRVFPEIGEVVYESARFLIKHEKDLRTVLDAFPITIMGNIHENPELLEKNVNNQSKNK